LGKVFCNRRSNGDGDWQAIKKEGGIEILPVLKTISYKKLQVDRQNPFHQIVASFHWIVVFVRREIGQGFPHLWVGDAIQLDVFFGIGFASVQCQIEPFLRSLSGIKFQL